jgi:hypothetical protein
MSKKFGCKCEWSTSIPTTQPLRELLDSVRKTMARYLLSPQWYLTFRKRFDHVTEICHLTTLVPQMLLSMELSSKLITSVSMTLARNLNEHVLSVGKSQLFDIDVMISQFVRSHQNISHFTRPSNGKPKLGVFEFIIRVTHGMWKVTVIIRVIAFDTLALKPVEIMNVHRVWKLAPTLDHRMKKNVLAWNTASCIQLKVNSSFKGTYRHYLQGRKINRAMFFIFFHTGTFLIRPLRGKGFIPLKRRLIFNGLHNITPQKILFSLTTVVIASNDIEIKIFELFSVQVHSHSLFPTEDFSSMVTVLLWINLSIGQHINPQHMTYCSQCKLPADSCNRIFICSTFPTLFSFL